MTCCRLELVIPARGDSVRTFNKLLRTVVGTVSPSEADEFSVMLVADEAFQNAVDAVCQLEEPLDIFVRCFLTKDKFFMEVQNKTRVRLPRGNLCSRTAILDREINLLDEHGRGVRIMAQYAQRFQIRQLNDGTIRTRILVRLNYAKS